KLCCHAGRYSSRGIPSAPTQDPDELQGRGGRCDAARRNQALVKYHTHRQKPLAVDARIKELLKPEILNTVSGLELVARVIVEGFMSGSNKSQSVGAGQEFSQYRSYQPGDDLRQLDWKM